MSSIKTPAKNCYHCSLPIPRDCALAVVIEGQLQSMCCPGCQAVATAIVDGGLGNFYQFRTENSARPESECENFLLYDLADVQSDFVTEALENMPKNTGYHSEKGVFNNGAQIKRAQLLLEGMTCAACSWLIERHLQALDGVKKFTINSSSHRISIDFDPELIALSQLMAELSSIGYKPSPATNEQQLHLYQQQNRSALMRLALAGFGMMQVGMVATALYAGAIQGMDSHWQHYLHWISLIIATPVVFYSAQPFFKAAWRNLKHKTLSMDVPVSLAIGGAYLASCWATITAQGEVYFDSVSMFTFFLLLGRYLEMRARHNNKIDAVSVKQLLPFSAKLLSDKNGDYRQEPRTVPVKSLQVGDCVWVKSGETLPCDGVVLAGHSSVVEALLTGESAPVVKTVGDTVVAGTLNGESLLEVSVTAVGTQTQLALIDRLAADGEVDKPRQATLADRLSRYFVAAVLLTSVIVFSYWMVADAERAFWITLSVLVVTCPCALSLATPAALTASTRWLRRQGFLITRGHVLESLASVSTLVLDKTGTLTEGNLSVKTVELLNPELMNEEQVLALASALEHSSNHPIAAAFKRYPQHIDIAQVRHFTAAGIEACVCAEHVAGANMSIANGLYRLGTPAFALRTIDVIKAIDGRQEAENNPTEELKVRQGQWLLLASERQSLAWIELSDQVRASAAAMVNYFRQQQVRVELLSGDHSSAVAELAQRLNVDCYRSAATPADKLAYIRCLQARGEKVLMVGDGINDVPVLAAANVSIAMNNATDLAKTRADSVLLSGNLTVISQAVGKARDTRRIIRQNLLWALIYNVTALPLAAMGMVPPWAAAIGMSCSSLIVIGNSLRLNR